MEAADGVVSRRVAVALNDGKTTKNLQGFVACGCDDDAGRRWTALPFDAKMIVIGG